MMNSPPVQFPPHPRPETPPTPPPRTVKDLYDIAVEYDRLKASGGIVSVQKVDDIDGLLLQLGGLLPQLTDLEAVLKVTDRWLKAYALKTKQDPPKEDEMGSKFGGRK